MRMCVDLDPAATPPRMQWHYQRRRFRDGQIYKQLQGLHHSGGKPGDPKALVRWVRDTVLVGKRGSDRDPRHNPRYMGSSRDFTGHTLVTWALAGILQDILSLHGL